ncbi:hypothetical protein D3C87_293210 [compost metagenome]|jgi:hypothetical protein
MPLDAAESWGVDGVIVVNLDRRPDRWAAFQDAWRDILPWDRVVRLSASDGQQLPGYGEKPWFRGRKRDRTWAGRAGCTLSHARALREARRLGWARVLVMEDDAIPAGPIEALPAVLSSTGWELLYLGCREPIGVGETVGGLMTIHGGHDTHAYAVNQSLRDWLIAQLPDDTSVWGWIARERAVDRWMRREIGRRFSVKLCQPQLAIQADDVSDITQRREGAYASSSAARKSARRPSELGRIVERAEDRIRATVKRMVGF